MRIVVRLGKKQKEMRLSVVYPKSSSYKEFQLPILQTQGNSCV